MDRFWEIVVGATPLVLILFLPVELSLLRMLRLPRFGHHQPTPRINVGAS